MNFDWFFSKIEIFSKLGQIFITCQKICNEKYSYRNLILKPKPLIHKRGCSLIFSFSFCVAYFLFSVAKKRSCGIIQYQFRGHIFCVKPLIFDKVGSAKSAENATLEVAGEQSINFWSILATKKFSGRGVIDWDAWEEKNLKVVGVHQINFHFL